VSPLTQPQVCYIHTAVPHASYTGESGIIGETDWHTYRPTDGIGDRCIVSSLQRVSLIVIPFCLSVWMSVGHSVTYSLPRLIDHNQIWSVLVWEIGDPKRLTRVNFFGSPISHTFGSRGKNMQNFAYFQWQPFNAYSCHCERDASCHMTCFSSTYILLIASDVPTTDAD